MLQSTTKLVQIGAKTPKMVKNGETIVKIDSNMIKSIQKILEIPSMPRASSGEVNKASLHDEEHQNDSKVSKDLDVRFWQTYARRYVVSRS